MKDFTEFDAFQRCRDFARGRDGNREFSQFVPITKGSVGEARGQLLSGVDFRYLNVENFEELNGLGQRAGQCPGGLMRHLNSTEIRERKFKFASNRRDKEGR